MLLAFLLIQGVSQDIVALPPIAVEVTGMAPQIAFIRRAAAERGWRITCEGRAGEERVLRLDTAGEASAAVAEALNNRVSGSRFYYPAGARPASTCDQEPVVTIGGGRRPLAFGTEAQLAPLLEIARACGFAQANIRAPRPAEIPAAVILGAGAETLVLSTEDDAGRRHGPGICFRQMQHPQGGDRLRLAPPSSPPALP